LTVGQLARPGAGETDLGVLAGRAGGAPGRRPARELGVDLHDATRSASPHSGHDGATNEHRALDEALEVRQVLVPAHLFKPSLPLRAGGVEDQHADRPERGRDGGHELVDLALGRDVADACVGNAMTASATPRSFRIAAATSTASP
jgi:hypothetical protein